MLPQLESGAACVAAVEAYDPSSEPPFHALLLASLSEEIHQLSCLATVDTFQIQDSFERSTQGHLRGPEKSQIERANTNFNFIISTNSP
mmetsp:Transcript_8983/g.17907  ORF Transcript_8983/g.17907 Transcript_8983/m.17907 type:complete len:89 (-) Transcript_8983:19-285(-)